LRNSLPATHNMDIPSPPRVVPLAALHLSGFEHVSATSPEVQQIITSISSLTETSIVYSVRDIKVEKHQGWAVIWVPVGRKLRVQHRLATALQEPESGQADPRSPRVLATLSHHHWLLCPTSTLTSPTGSSTSGSSSPTAAAASRGNNDIIRRFDADDPAPRSGGEETTMARIMNKVPPTTTIVTAAAAANPKRNVPRRLHLRSLDKPQTAFKEALAVCPLAREGHHPPAERALARPSKAHCGLSKLLACPECGQQWRIVTPGGDNNNY
jgi:hypothetical protein